jgi:hypothetical protein
MADSRKHRGPHPADTDLFAPSTWPALQTAVSELSWLLDRGYAMPSSLKLVGDRHNLQERQRTAVKRSACTGEALDARAQKCVPLSEVREVWIDGFNLLTTIEAALGGGVILIGRDACCRDMASMHGTYRKVLETQPALELIGTHLSKHGVGKANWLLDQPVSNSGRLAGIIRKVAGEHGWDWDVKVVRDPDPVLSGHPGVVVSADSEILNRCQQWTNVAAKIVATVPDARVIQM